MESSEVVVPSFCNDFTVLDENTTDQGIGSHTPTTTFSNVESALHECLVFFSPHRGSSSMPKGIELMSLFVHPWIH
jgi:hypothetical protein